MILKISDLLPSPKLKIKGDDRASIAVSVAFLVLNRPTIIRTSATSYFQPITLGEATEKSPNGRVLVREFHVPSR